LLLVSLGDGDRGTKLTSSQSGMWYLAARTEGSSCSELRELERRQQGLHR